MLSRFSWQKVLGGEGGHGVLDPQPAGRRAVGELHARPWPLPKIFRMTKGGKLTEGIFEGATINTPSMLCVEDYLDALQWAAAIAADAMRLFERADRQRRDPRRPFVERTAWIDHLAVDPGHPVQYVRCA